MTHDRPNHKWWTLFAMCFALFMIMLDNTVVNVALPKIQKDLNADPASLEWTLNAYVLTFAALILLGGKLGDRFGRKRFFIIGVVVFTVASAACALSTSDTQLIAARTLQGVGAAMLNPLSLSILVAAFPRQQLPQAIGIWAGISGLGLAIGPLLGGFLVEHVSWSAVFWINVPIGVGGGRRRRLGGGREPRDPQTRTLDVVGTLLVTGGLFSLVWALIETTSHSWTSLYTLGFLGTAAVLFTLFLFWESAPSRSDGAAGAVPKPRIHRGQHGGLAGRLRNVRRDLLHHPLLPERAGLLADGGRCALAAADPDGAVRVPGGRQAELQVPARGRC